MSGRGRVPWHSSLRLRFAAALAIMAFLIASLLGARIAYVALQDARAQLREQAASTLRAGTATYEVTGEVAPTVRIGDSGLPSGLVQRVGEDGAPLTYDDGSATWAAMRASDGTVLAVRLPDGPATERWQRLSRTILGLSLGAAAVSSGVGWFVAGRLTRRLRTAAEHAADLPAEGSSAMAAPLSGTHDEVFVLSRAIDETVRELHARIRNERELTADVAHELRTPLTALTSAAELLEDGDDAQRVRMLIARMRHLVDDMLVLAREEAARASARDAPRAGVETQELAAQAAAASAGEVEVRAMRSARATCDASLIVSVLESLVHNARRHGAPPVVIEVDGLVLRVRDHGPGFPAELLEQGPRRFHPVGPTGGTGLGLVIAERRVARAGGEISFRNAADGGGEVEIRLRAEDDLDGAARGRARPSS